MRTKTEVPTLNEKKLTVMAGANGYQNSLLSAGYTETADALQGSTSILTLRPRCQGRTRCRGSSTARTRHLRRHAAQPARACARHSRRTLQLVRGKIDRVAVLNEDAVFTPYVGIVFDVTQWASV